MRFLLLSALALFLSLPAMAQDYNGLQLPPPGTTIMNLSATETRKVPQDLLVASVRIEADEATPGAVQDKINKAMAAAIDLAKKQPDVKYETGSYSVYPYDPAPPSNDPYAQKKPQRWKGQQELDLKSLKPDPLLALVGDLQGKGFAMSNLGYTLSPEKYESVQDDLLTRAMAKLQAKAALATKTLGKGSYDMLNVDLSPSGPVYPVMYARAAMAMDAGMAKAAPPVAAAGESDVSLTVSARVLLKP